MANLLHILKLKTCILIFSLLTSQIILSQSETYLTKNGNIQISTIINGKVINAYSHKLIIQLDYSNALIKLYLDKSTLETDNDSLKQIINSFGGLTIEANGKLGVSFIETKMHPQQNFNVYLGFTKGLVGQHFQGQGTLTHLEGRLACLLKMNFQLKLDSNQLIPYFKEPEINIRILQTLLKKSTDK